MTNLPAETIAAISTPPAVGGISVLRISGPRAIEAADCVFRTVSGTPLSAHKGYTAAYGTVFDGGEPVDDAIATVFRAPKSYTGEDVVEISCHGGLYVTRRVLMAILKQDVSMAQPGEFTKRAFLNGKMTLTEAEAVADLIQAGGEQSLRSARSAMQGELYRKIRAMTERMLAVSGHIAAFLDYPEEEIDPVESHEIADSIEAVRAELQTLLDSFDQGRMIREGIETVILGKPNVGKSTLMNLLAGARKSIVTDIPGTTRDVVEETVRLDGLVLRLADTAGIRDTSDLVEQAGVALAWERLESAQLILAVFDSSSPLSEEDRLLMDRIQNLPVVAVCNKSDISGGLEIEELRQRFSHVVEISARENQGVELLSEAVRDVLSLCHIDPSSAMLANMRQFECAQRAAQRLAEAQQTLEAGFTLDAVDVSLEDVIASLLELTGERVTDAVVDQVFSHFCVGK
ncbi:MAG: tRNA uridine-5-carboxymethylaminomethyl(34) synthesis GTPase MnmE [Candidatus Merdivicinus sp.]|jgi:tRNA modification GTPase